MIQRGDFVRWTVEPDLDLPPLVGECAITIKRNGLQFELRSKKRISEVIAECQRRFGSEQ